MEKIIKFKKETKEYQILNVIATVLCIVAVIVLLYSGFYLLTSKSFFEGLGYACLMIIIFIGYLSLVSYVESKSKNKAYYEQQTELDRLKKLEKSCGEYHRLKKKYEGE